MSNEQGRRIDDKRSQEEVDWSEVREVLSSHPMPAQAAATEQASQITDTDSAREFLVKFTEQHFTDKTFHRYIRNDQGNRQGLAGDFAWQLAKALESLATPADAGAAAPVSQDAELVARDKALLDHLDAWVAENKAAGHDWFTFSFSSDKSARVQIGMEMHLKGKPQPVAAAADQKVCAWMTEDGERVVSATTKEGQVRDGGASASAMRPYTVPLVRVGAAAAGEDARMHSWRSIGPLPVERDEAGWWSHPAIPNFDDDFKAYKAWVKAVGLETTYKALESDPDHPLHDAWFERGECDASSWTPTPPAGAGWFTFSIHDTEDGPVWVWARRVADAASSPVESAKQGGSE